MYIFILKYIFILINIKVYKKLIGDNAKMITKEEFDNLKRIEQIEYMNNYFLENEKMNLTQFAKDLGIGRQTIVDRAKKVGYRYNKYFRQFQLVDNAEEEQKPLKSNLKPLNNDIDINTLLKRIEVLENRVNILENKANTNDNKEYTVNPLNNKIRFYPKHSDTTYTIRVNLDVYQKFKEFANKYSQYKQRDLISSALALYMEMFEDKE